MRNFTLSILLLLALFAIPAFGQSKPQPNRKAVDLMAAGKFRDAITVLDRDIEKDKNVLASLTLRADLKRMIGDFHGSLEDLNKAIAMDSSDGPLYERRANVNMILGQDMSKILADLDLAAANGAKTANVLSTRGMIRFFFGDLDGSIADYEAATLLRPDLAGAQLGLAHNYIRKNDYGKATSILENFIEKVENSDGGPPPVEGKTVASSSVALPQVHGKDIVSGQETVIIVQRSADRPKSPEEARMADERLEQARTIVTIYGELASLYERAGDYSKALTTVEKGLRLDPNEAFAYEVRAKVKLGLKDYDGAVPDAAKAIRMLPPRAAATAYATRGIAYLMLGKEAEAQKDFDKYLELFPKGKEFLDKRIEKAKAQAQQP